MNVQAEIVKMQLNGDYDPPMMDMTFEYQLDDCDDFEQTTFTWSQKLAEEFNVGQTISIILGVSELVG